ncbi:protein phosphatase 2C family, partial [Kipferlia bialata]|eukprot:g11045.t1
MPGLMSLFGCLAPAKLTPSDMDAMASGPRADVADGIANDSARALLVDFRAQQAQAILTRHQETGRGSPTPTLYEREDVNTLADALQGVSAAGPLETLVIRARLTSLGLAVFCDILRASETPLHSLTLCDQDLEDPDAAASLLGYISSDHCLECLVLDGCLIGGDTAFPLGEAVTCCATMERIEIRNMGDGFQTEEEVDEVVMQLCDALSLPPDPDEDYLCYGEGVRELVLCNVGMSDLGACVVGELLVQSPSIHHCDVSHNNIQQDGADMLAMTCKVNPRIRVLDLVGNSIVPRVLYRIDDTCRRNTLLHDVIEQCIEGSLSPATSEALRIERECAASACDLDEGDTPEGVGTDMAGVVHDLRVSLEVGASDTVGRRNEMEDVAIEIPVFRGDPAQSLFCLFDGHGGRCTAQHAAERFPAVFTEHLPIEDAANPPAIRAALLKTYSRINAEITTLGFDDGTTALIVYRCGTLLVTSNVGDT